MSDANSTSRIKIPWLFGTAAAMAIFAVVGAYSFRMTRDYEGYDKQRAQERAEVRAKVDAAENAQLTKVDWVSQEDKVVTIPVDQAMQKEIITLQTKPVGPGSVIPVAAPAAPAPAPATASTNAAPAAPAPAPAKENPKK